REQCCTVSAHVNPRFLPRKSRGCTALHAHCSAVRYLLVKGLRQHMGRKDSRTFLWGFGIRDKEEWRRAESNRRQEGSFRAENCTNRRNPRPGRILTARSERAVGVQSAHQQRKG